MKTYIIFILLLFNWACRSNPKTFEEKPTQKVADFDIFENVTKFDTTTKTIHILVSLCDNVYQGIVPVSVSLGNGQNPASNLYWGAGFGIKTYFKKSKNWTLLKTEKGSYPILERLIFKHKTKPFYIVADAYDGQHILKCTKDLLYSCSGQKKDTISIKNKTLGIYGNAKMVVYIGHNGLMDFTLKDKFGNIDKKSRDCIVLACNSKAYFKDYFKTLKTNVFLWTTGLMCPEAYSLHDALDAYMAGKSKSDVHLEASKAYAKYQKCNLRAAKNLIVAN
ncbi:MAG: hypothetical protein MUC49_06920 [Raineya sp.]|jgi:hypothetical protein|nr:hypothetical protein [Raineya sp.]